MPYASGAALNAAFAWVVPSEITETNANVVVPSLTVYITDTLTPPVSASIEHESVMHAASPVAADAACVMVTVVAAVTVYRPSVQLTTPMSPSPVTGSLGPRVTDVVVSIGRLTYEEPFQYFNVPVRVDQAAVVFCDAPRSTRTLSLIHI